jgi:hypothetical protein
MRSFSISDRFHRFDGDWPTAREIGVAVVCGALAGGIVLAVSHFLTVSLSTLAFLEGLSALVLALVCVRKPIAISLYFGWIAVQNTMLPWMHATGLLGAEAVRLAIAFKEMVSLALLTVVIVIAARRRGFTLGWGDPELWIGGYSIVLVWALTSPWAGDAPLGAKGVAFRTLAMPAMFFFMGRLFPADRVAADRLVKGTLLLFTGVAVFGFVERLLLPVEFWRSVIGIGAYITDVKGIAPDFHVEEGLVANMYRFGVRRMVSTFGDPLACGYALILPTVIAAVGLWQPTSAGRVVGRERLYVHICLGLLVSALVMTINRGAILTMLVGLSFAFFSGGRLRYLLIAAIAIAVLMIGNPWVANMVYETVTLQEGSARVHYEHLVQGVASLMAPSFIFGIGLGRSGFWAQELFGSTLAGIGENSFFMIVVQVGILGATFFGAFMLTVVRSLRQVSAGCQDLWLGALGRAVGATLFAHLIVANTSENIFSFTGMAQAWFLTGLAVRTGRLHSK